MRKITAKDIGTLILALVAPFSTARAELPSDYKNWPIKEVSESHTTYRQSNENGSPVVREFNAALVGDGVFMRYVIIGHAPESDETAERRPLEIGITPNHIGKFIEKDIKKECGRCHPIINSETYQ